MTFELYLTPDHFINHCHVQSQHNHKPICPQIKSNKLAFIMQLTPIYLKVLLYSLNTRFRGFYTTTQNVKNLREKVEKPSKTYVEQLKVPIKHSLSLEITNEY